MFSKIFSRVLAAYSRPATSPRGSGACVKVNLVVSKPAFWYEKLRSAVDYREDHLLKKAAIFRNLKRFLFLERRHDKIAEHLIQEMIRARYVENECVSESMVEEVDQIINKYLWLIYKVKERKFKKLPRKWVDELIEICAVEIEKKLAVNLRDEELLKAMFASLCNRVELVGSDLDERQKEMQIFIATHKALTRADISMLDFAMLKMNYSDWTKNPSQKLIDDIAEDYENMMKEFSVAINHPWQGRLAKIARKEAMVFTILRDVLNENSDDVASLAEDSDKLAAAASKAVGARQQKIRGRMTRAAVRAIIYVLITKMTLALLIEIPIDYYFGLGINYFAIAVNITLPPALMFLVAILITMPAKGNTEKIASEIKRIVYEAERKTDFTLHLHGGRPWLVNVLYNILYTAFFICVLYLLVKGLYFIHFGPISVALFIFFVALVSFFGLRIRRPVRELFVIDKKENALLLLMDFLFTPFISLGNWLSIKFSQINIFAMILDFLIESPFKLLVATTEDLTDFVREKKEDLDRGL